jgi:nucleotide-binding universal stress UspA family protein
MTRPPGPVAWSSPSGIRTATQGWPLVVGFDRDAVSRAALTVAADLAGRLAARLVVVHVVDLDDYPIDPEAADWEEQRAGGATRSVSAAWPARGVAGERAPSGVP